MQQNKELKKSGLKVTHPSVTILNILKKIGSQHVSAEDIYRLLLESGEEIGLATVYRVLNQFDDAGIIDRHYFEGGKSVFELSGELHHDHLVCLKCGKVVEFEDNVIEQCQKDVAANHDMTLTNHSLYLYGECKDGCTENFK
jgi:Fur family ferric uptake transcriptional regulator